jgi:hypothetical protein
MDGVILKGKRRNFWRTLCDKEAWNWELGAAGISVIFWSSPESFFFFWLRS